MVVGVAPDSLGVLLHSLRVLLLLEQSVALFPCLLRLDRVEVRLRLAVFEFSFRLVEPFEGIRVAILHE